MKENKQLMIQSPPVSVQHGAGSVMSWACTGTGSLVFTDGFTADRSSKVNTEVYRSFLSGSVKCIKSSWTIFHHSAGIWSWSYNRSHHRAFQGEEVERAWPTQVSHLSSVKLSSVPLGEDRTQGWESPQQQELMEAAVKLLRYKVSGNVCGSHFKVHVLKLRAKNILNSYNVLRLSWYFYYNLWSHFISVLSYPPL